ncbi:putative NADPH-dependent beta-ketoacyl reductase [Mycena olivaceomarginata]|nr:putative NADPH-dependent beta-ketoacyl reductase [Mycena olivaceomarginata]
MSAQDLAITSLFDVKGRSAVEDIRKVATGKINYIVADVGSKAGCDALIAEFKRRETTLHVLKGWDNVFNVNVKSSRLSDYLTKDSTSTDPTRVINISSTASVDPFSEGELSAAGNGTWSYQPSKAAVNHLTSALAVKLAPKFVTVNAILPGYLSQRCAPCMITDVHSEVYPSKMTAFGFKTSGDKMVASQPMGRVGAPSDMAGLALFLASPAAAHITGAHIITDGGARLFRQAKL